MTYTQEVADEQASISGLSQDENASQLPCILNGAMAGLSGGCLGYVFGFGALHKFIKGI